MWLNGRRNNRVGPRGKSGKIMDDYYFQISAGEYRLKEGDQEYEYSPELGVWRSTKEVIPANLPANTPTPREYYFDKEEGEFILKKKLQYGEIALNQNINLWMQRWRRPIDYYYEPRQNKYLRKPASMIADEKANAAAAGMAAAGGKGGPGDGGVIGPDGNYISNADIQKEKDRRDYERPWLHNYILLAADEIRFEQELKKKTKAKKGGKTSVNIDATGVTESKAQPNINANDPGEGSALAESGGPTVAPSEDSMASGGSKGSKRKKKKGK
ncbi:unnamed protein product [Orchesella dallaii]|uniref:Uncharacterized protein n=1 Tax=Orchesella dallaii TaxID=48710 RepID=A0ABP1Q9B9_9HEXA